MPSFINTRHPARTLIITSLTFCGLAGLALAGAMADRPHVTPHAVDLHEFARHLPDTLHLHLQDIQREINSAGHLNARANVIPFDEAHIFFEENTTDGDLGVHFKVDGSEWRRILILDPSFRRYADVRAFGTAAENGLTEIFNESAEPSFDDVPREEFLDWFPEGDYVFFGWSVDGDLLVGTAALTHDLPAPPVITSPQPDEEVEAADPLSLTWDPVPAPGEDSEIVAYQVVVERDDDKGPFTKVTVDLGPDATSFTIAPGFLEADTDYKVELIARETSGNQSITEVEFSTAE